MSATLRCRSKSSAQQEPTSEFMRLRLSPCDDSETDPTHPAPRRAYIEKGPSRQVHVIYRSSSLPPSLSPIGPWEFRVRHVRNPLREGNHVARIALCT